MHGMQQCLQHFKWLYRFVCVCARARVQACAGYVCWQPLISQLCIVGYFQVRQNPCLNNARFPLQALPEYWSCTHKQRLEDATWTYAHYGSRGVTGHGFHGSRQPLYTHMAVVIAATSTNI